jgi:hypothetical protein
MGMSWFGALDMTNKTNPSLIDIYAYAFAPFL